MKAYAAYTPNRARVRVYDAEQDARKLVKTFKDRDVSATINLRHDWPRVWQNVGDNLAVGYTSDKWGLKDTLYKHLAESRNYAFVVPGFLRDHGNPNKPWRTIGPKVVIDDVPMPKHFTELAVFEEADLELYVAGTDDDPLFAGQVDDEDDAGIVKVTVPHAMLGGGKIKWSAVSDRKDQPFLFVYTEKDGPVMLITGDKLNVLRDGIVG